MVTRALPALVLAAGCAVAPASDSSTTTTEMTSAEPASEVAPVDEPAPAPRRGFQTREPELADRPGAVKLSLIARGGLGAELSPRGDVILVIRGRGGLLLPTSGKGKKRSLPRYRFVQSRFAPDGAHVALMDDRKRVVVVDIATGKKVAEIERAERPRWLDASTLSFKRGCAGFRYVLAGGQPASIGALPRCDKVVRSSADGRRWWVASRGRYRRGVIQTYKQLAVHDLTDQRRTVLFDGTDDAHFMMPEVSADGRRICYVDAMFDLFCRTGSETPERIWHNARRPIMLDDSGRWLLFAIGKHTSPDSKVGVVDLEERVITLVPRAGRQWWRFLDGGRRIAGDGGSSSAMVYDLEAGWKSSVGDARSEWEGLYPAPSGGDRFVVGRERGGTRDLYLVTIQ